MGLFDDIRFEYKLPNGHSTHTFQTKDTDSQCLDLYVVDKKGFLTKDGEKLSFSGGINFYTDVKEEWVEYQSIFWEGKLQKVKRIINKLENSRDKDNI